MVVVQEISYSVARGIFLDQGLNLRLLNWQLDFFCPSELPGKPESIGLTTGPPGKSHMIWCLLFCCCLSTLFLGSVLSAVNNLIHCFWHCIGFHGKHPSRFAYLFPISTNSARKSSYVAPCKPVHEFFWDVYTGMEFLNHEIYENLISLSTSRSFIPEVWSSFHSWCIRMCYTLKADRCF